MSKNIKVDSRGREQIPHWYAIGITTNKEKIIRSKVQELIKQKIWKDQIFNIVLPTKIEKDAKGKDKEVFEYKQIGYVHMILNDDTWNALEMLRTNGFRGILPGGNPMPIPMYEMEQVFEKIERPLDELKLTYEQLKLVDGDEIQEADFEEVITKGETVLFIDESERKEIGTIKEELENEYVIEIFEEGINVLKTIPKENVTKINE